MRKHGGLMVPTPVQAAAAAALGDDEHVVEQRALRPPPGQGAPRARGAGLVHDGGPSTFYLWLRAPREADDGWEIAADLAEAGTLVAPGDFYGEAGADHVRLALTITDDGSTSCVGRRGSPPSLRPVSTASRGDCTPWPTSSRPSPRSGRTATTSPR